MIIVHLNLLFLFTHFSGNSKRFDVTSAISKFLQVDLTFIDHVDVLSGLCNFSEIDKILLHNHC